MKNQNIPFFELDGKKYEIKRNRYLQAEYDRIVSESSGLTEEEEKSFALLQDKYAGLERLAKRTKELEDKYYQTFEEKDGELYNRAKAEYDKVLKSVIEFEAMQKGIAQKVQNVGLSNAEMVLIRALQIDTSGQEIRSEVEANNIWCSYVDQVGKQTASNWLLYFISYITGKDEDDDPFVAQAKAKAEQRANMKKGLKIVK